jgi:ABC-type protease/lipase transport system fused ATPase/permease subunit
VATWDSEDLGRHVGYLPQDVELFNGTIRANIARMGDEESSAIVDAARLAEVHEVILGMEDGYETEIGDHGAILSGGQSQRVALARALFGDPRLVVLDEPNANLDQDGDDALARTLQRLSQRKVTTVVITHRLWILRHVDKILLLRNGNVDMFGPRDEILSKIARPAAAPMRQTVLESSHG